MTGPELRKRRRPTFERGFLAGAVVAVALVVAAGFLALREIGELNEAFASFRRTHDLLGQIESVWSAALDAETGQRGFVLTGERAYLEPYAEGVRRLAGEIDALEAMLETPAQRRQVDELRALTATKLAELAQSIERRDAEGFDGALAVVKTDLGKHTMGQIRGLLDALRADTEVVLVERIAARQALSRRVQLTTLGLAGLSLVILVAVLRSLDQATRRRAAADSLAIESEQRLRVTLASIGDAVIATDTGGAVVFMNAVARTLTGFRESDAIGLPLDQVFRIVNEFTRGTVESPFSKVMRSGDVVGLGNHTLLIARDGSERPIDDSGAPIRDAAGEIMGVVLVFRDVTGRRLSEQARERLVRTELERDVAESASRAKDEFLAIVSHELRSPLSAAATWVGLLRSGTLDEARRASGLATIDRNLRQQARLIDDLVDVSRIVAGKLTIECLPIDVVGIARATVDDARDKAEAKKVSLRLEAPAAPAMAFADAGRLVQVLGNLLDNAIKFTPAGGRVEVALRTRDDVIEIEVRDNGEGLSPEVLPNVFERFRQAQGALRRGRAGMGLGLAIARHLVELHGGTLVAESEGEKQGATFRVTLPALASDSSADETPAAPRPGEGAASLTGMRVLLVEDHGDSREAMALALRSRGAVVREAGSATEALALTDDELPDILVSDIGMPDMSGLDLIREMRRRGTERGVYVPAIALTGFASLSERQETLAAGYDRHISKPVDFKRLIDAMRTLRAERDAAP